MRVIRWIIINSIFLLFFYLWLGMGIESAGTFICCISWIMCLISLTYLSDGVIKAHIKQGVEKPSVPLWIDGIYDIGILFLFLIGDAPYTAVAYLVSTVMTHLHYKRLREILGDL